MGFFQDLFGDTAAKAATDAAQQKVAGLQAAQNYAEPLYNTAQGNITQGYGQAQNAWQPIYNVGQAGANYYADITGANGPEGQARAQATFQTDPGYQFAVSQALQATQRQQGAGGFQNSGNVNAALEDRASGLAQQQYGQYVQRLAPFLNYSLAGGAGLSNAYTGQGTALAGLNTQLANLGYGTQAGIGSAEAAGTLGAAQARTQAAGNIANLGTKLLGYALAPAPGGLSAGIGSLFGGSGGGLDFGNLTDEQIMRGYA